jgi:hypothetical protein
MLTRLREEIEEVEIFPVAGELKEALELRSRLDAKISSAVADFDAAGLYELDQATSMTAWLRHEARMTSRDAGRMTSIAKGLRALPVTRGAWEDGTLSAGQVQAVVANVSRRIEHLFARDEDELVPTLAVLAVKDVAGVMQEWAEQAKDSLDPDLPEPPPEPERALHLSMLLEGRYRLDADLDAEGGSLTEVAIRLAETPDGPADPARTPAHRRADAWVDICRFYLDNQQTRAGGRHRPHLNIVIDLDGIATRSFGEIVGGPVLDGVTVSRLLCDAGIHRCVMEGRSAILDYGTTTRTVPTPLWNALVLRDTHCRAPGCDRRPKWCEGHHVKWVTDAGETNLANLVLACPRHHHLWHSGDWELKLLPNAELHITGPDGRTWVTRPPP